MDSKSSKDGDPSPSKMNEVADRLEHNQRLVADQERANRIKAQDLIQRERKLDDDHRLLQQERRMLDETRTALTKSSNRRSALVLPLMLIAAIAAGIFAFDNVEQQKRYLQQVEKAAQNIDALTRIISSTQDEVVITTSKLSSKQMELEKTKTMLTELRNTTDQLKFEINQLKGDPGTTSQERLALSASAGNLSQQLRELREQLEDRYLTNDINEVYIEYQESDLKHAQQLIRTQEAELENNRRVIAEKNETIDELKNSLSQTKS